MSKREEMSQDVLASTKRIKELQQSVFTLTKFYWTNTDNSLNLESIAAYGPKSDERSSSSYRSIEIKK